jgi:hypothetical protein
MELHKWYDVVWSQFSGTDGMPGYCSRLFGKPRYSFFPILHLFSCKKWLFDNINKEDFLDIDGTFYEK